MTSPAEMKLCGTVAAIFSALLNETKTLDDISEVIFEPSRNTGGLDNSAHPVKNYGIPVPFTIFKEGALQKVPPASSDAKLKPSPLTDWGDITVKYTNESMKTTLETLITKYPNSIKSFVEIASTTTAGEAVATSTVDDDDAPAPAAAPAPAPAAAAAAPAPDDDAPAPAAAPAAVAAASAAAVAASAAAANDTPATPPPPATPPAKLRTRRRKKVKKPLKTEPVGVQPVNVPMSSTKDTVVVTAEGIVAPYKVGANWCEVIIGKGEVGKNGDHLRICSATEESLEALSNSHRQTMPLQDAYTNCGGVPCDTQEGE